MTKRYHHGDLPTALRAATAELVAEKGASGFSLREVARRAGVSHAAPAHHFGDAEGMLTSVAAEGFHRLADELTAASIDATDAADLLRRTGIAYVRVAIENPGHFAVMMQNDLVCADDPDLLAEGVRAYEALLAVMAAIRDEHNPQLDIETAATFTWSAVQGLVVLSPSLAQVAEDTNTSTAPLEDIVGEFANLILQGMAAR